MCGEDQPPDGNPVFTFDLSRWSVVTSNAAGLVGLAENHANCPTGIEVQRYAW
jgi:hypothetical protein